MEGKMKVAVMKGIRQMEFEEWPIPQIKDDEVLVKINHVGVCGSDLHFFEAGRIGNWIVDSDLVLGHDAAVHGVFRPGIADDDAVREKPAEIRNVRIVALIGDGAGGEV